MTDAKISALLRGQVLVVTGAGISVASGLSTFRGSGGFYQGRNPYELASPEGFAEDPVRVWNWYLSRMREGAAAQPNAAHYALVEIERRAARFTLVTSNVDSLHQQAGSSRVFRLHGNILERRCLSQPSHLESWDLTDLPPTDLCAEQLPRCGTCGLLMRPNVVWFGEYPWPEAILTVQRELPDANVVLEIGQSGAVSYGFTELAVELGIPAVRVNPEGPCPPGVHWVAEPAEVALPRWVAL